MKNVYKNSLSGVIILLLTLFIFSCGNEKPAIVGEEGEACCEDESSVEFTEDQYKNVGILFGKMEQRTLSGTIKVNGLLDVPPQNLVTISIPYGGTIKQTDLLQGMKVEKGQVLAVLENPEYIQLQQDYLDSKSKLTYLELELSRQEQLQKENISAAKLYQQVVSEYESLKSRVSGLEIKLSMLSISPEQIRKNGIVRQVKIVAPISGYVTEVNVNIGSYITQNDIICKIVDTRHLHAELTVFEKDIMRLKIGQKVRFLLNNEGPERTATVYLIGREITVDRTIRVHCHLDKEDPNLLPGMYLNAYIETETKAVASILSKAIVPSEGKNYLFLSKGKEVEEGVQMYHFEKVEITTGINENGYTEIVTSKGIDSSSVIVTNGAYELLSKMLVGEEEGCTGE